MDSCLPTALPYQGAYVGAGYHNAVSGNLFWGQGVCRAVESIAIAGSPSPHDISQASCIGWLCARLCCY